MRYSAALVFALAAPLLAGGGSDASPSAILNGTVVAERAETPLEGVHLTLVNATGRFESHSGARGRYEFTGVAAGTYSLTVESEGFAPGRYELSLAPRETRLFDIRLEIRTVNESIVVAESAAEVAAVAEASSRAVAEEDLQNLPSNGRSLSRFALLDARVRQTQGLGSDGAASARLSIAANSFRHTNHMLDGVSNYDVIFGNAPQQTVSLAAVEEVKVIANQYSAEYGGSTAGTVAAVTRVGGDQFHFDAFSFLRPSGIQARPPLSNLRTPNQRLQYGASASGPVVRGRTAFTAAYEAIGQSRGSFIQSPAPRTFTGNLEEWMALARIDHRLTDRHSLTLRLTGQRSQNNNSNDRVGGFTQPSAEQLSETQATGAQATWRVSGARSVNEARAAFTAYTPSATRTPVPAVSIVRPNYSTEGGSANSWVHARSFVLSDTLGVQSGAHSIRVGAEAERHVAKDYSNTPFGEYRFASGPPTPGDQPIQYTQTFGQAMLRYGQTLTAAFVQDNWKVAPRLTASLGVRYERQSITDDRNNLAPRAALAWDVTGHGGTVIRAGAGLFYDQYYFYITRRFFLQGPDAPTKTMTIPFGAPDFPVFPSTLAFAPSSGSGARRDLYLRPAKVLNPYSLQYSLSLQQRLFGGWVLTADALHTHTLKQMRAVEINAPAPFDRSAAGQRRSTTQADATRPFARFGDLPVRSVLRIENSGASLYDSLAVGISRRFAKSHQIEFRYAYSSSTTYAMFFGEPNTGIPNEWAETGRAERGPSDFHQRHRFVLTSAFTLPWRSQLLTVVNAGSGLPVNPTTGVDNNGDTYLSDRPAGFGRNSFRGPLQASIDLAATKRVKLAEALNLELRAEGFNILNRNNYLKVNGVYGDGVAPSPLFLKPVAGLQNVDSARQLQLGVRLMW